MFSCKFYEISKSTFFTEHFQATASGLATVETNLAQATVFLIIRSKTTLPLHYFHFTPRKIDLLEKVENVNM